jgi:hypothetical protein
LWAFNGGQPILVSPEIKPTWDAINWLYGDTIWVRNDIVNRKIYVGAPMATPNQWLPNAPVNANPTAPNVVLMLNYKELNTFNDLVERGGVKISYLGKLIAWDMSRKWSLWQIPCPYADFITSAQGQAPLYFCNGQANSEISQQVYGQLNDNGGAIDSLYTTYGFVKDTDRAEFGPLLSAHRNLYKYLDMNLYGTGQMLISLLPNVLTPTYPYALPPITMANPAQNNTERPINQTGNRMFVQFRSTLLGSGFNLSSLTVSMVKDPHAPIRGISPPTGIAVAVTPASATISPNATQQYAATVSGTSNQAVIWSVVEGAGGGTISAAGLYTAPAAVGTYHIKAVSQQDPWQSATAPVMVGAYLLQESGAPNLFLLEGSVSSAILLE